MLRISTILSLPVKILPSPNTKPFEGIKSGIWIILNTFLSSFCHLSNSALYPGNKTTRIPRQGFYNTSLGFLQFFETHCVTAYLSDDKH